jgi:hypothetical protein
MAFVVTCVRWNGGRVIKKAISVVRCAGDVLRYPMIPAKLPDVGFEEGSVLVRVLSMTAYRTAVSEPMRPLISCSTKSETSLNGPQGVKS